MPQKARQNIKDWDAFDEWVRAKFNKIAGDHPDMVPLLKELRKELGLIVDINTEYELFKNTTAKARNH
jgi:hypothetical protein